MKTRKSNSKTISVWGALSVEGKSKLVSINGRLEKGQYIRILFEALLLFAAERRGRCINIVFQQDNCPIHTVHEAVNFLAAYGIALKQFPLQNQDVAPIEKMCSRMKSALAKK